MTIRINVAILKPVECSFEVIDRELEIMVAQGVDVRDEWAVSDFYRAHLGQEVDGHWFMDLNRIADQYEHTGWPPEVQEWDVEGEAPDQFWPDEESADA